MEEKIEKSPEKEIDLGSILNILKKNIIPLVLAAAVFGAGFYIYSRFFITKKYEASAMLIVNNLSNNKSTVSSGEITAAQSLADVYSEIITSDKVLNTVIQDLGLAVSSDQLKGSIKVSTLNSTQIIEIKMTHRDAEYAKKVVAEIVKVAPPRIQEIVAAGSVKTISNARVTNGGAAVSPNNTRNGLIGALIGLVLMLAIVFLKEFVNNTFKTEEELTSTLGVPVLGMIPAIDAKTFNKGA